MVRVSDIGMGGSDDQSRYANAPIAARNLLPSTRSARATLHAAQSTTYFVVASMHMWMKPNTSSNRNIIMIMVSVTACPASFPRSRAPIVRRRLLRDVLAEHALFDIADPALGRRLHVRPVVENKHRDDHDGHEADDHQLFSRRLTALVLRETAPGFVCPRREALHAFDGFDL